MSILEEETFSFIVKIWFEEEASLTRKPIWRGHITHIPSHKRAYFNTYDGIFKFIERYLKSTDSYTNNSK